MSLPEAAWILEDDQRPGRRRGFLGLVASGVEGFLLEPAEKVEAVSTPPVELPPRPVIAVHGLARRCGATVLARALAAELAGRDPAGTAAVASGVPSGGIPLATSAASRLAGELGEAAGAKATAVGRLCLVEGGQMGVLAEAARERAPLVLDAGTDALDPATATLTDLVVIVGVQATEPSLAHVVADFVRGLGRDPVVVVNRVAAGQAPDLGAVTLPESRMGAQLALGGRPARGELGKAIAALADRCGA